MELPTYTNIWKIEKRLYKLYDFRLPMPLPVGQIAVFLAIAVPYMVILTLAGIPFSHTCSGFTCCRPACWPGWSPGRSWRASGCPNWSLPAALLV